MKVVEHVWHPRLERSGEEHDACVRGQCLACGGASLAARIALEALASAVAALLALKLTLLPADVTRAVAGVPEVPERPHAVLIRPRLFARTQDVRDHCLIRPDQLRLLGLLRRAVRVELLPHLLACARGQQRHGAVVRAPEDARVPSHEVFLAI